MDRDPITGASCYLAAGLMMRPLSAIDLARWPTDPSARPGWIAGEKPVQA